MIRSVRIIACSLALAVGFGGLASAATEPVRSTQPAAKLTAQGSEKTLQRRRYDRRQPARGRHHYRDRRSSRDHHDYRRDRHVYRGGRYDNRRYDNRRYDYRGGRQHASRCWSQNQRSHFRGQPALISVRVCRDRYGRSYTVRGSERLVRYLRGARRHW